MVFDYAIYILWTLLFIIPIYCIWWYWSIPKNLPPGPIGLPFVGSFPWVKAWTAHETLTEWTKQYGQLFSFYQGSNLVIVLGDADVIDEALVKQSDVFSGRPFHLGLRLTNTPPNHAIAPAEGPFWKEQRRFAFNTLKGFGLGRPLLETKITEEAEQLLDAISGTNGQPFDPEPFINNAVSNVICTMLFGHRFSLNSELQEQLDRVNYRVIHSRRNTLSPELIFPWYQQYFSSRNQLEHQVKNDAELMHFVQKEIDLSKESLDVNGDPSCFVHAFCQAQANGVGEFFTDVQLRCVTFELFLGGTQTTVITLRWAIYYMAKYPDIQKRVRDEIHSVLGSRWPTYEDRHRLVYSEAVVMEVHRMASALPLSVMHRTTSDTRLRGYDIPESAYVLPLLWAVHRGERHFQNPNTFDPSRFLETDEESGEWKIKRELPLMPFAVGKRACLGEPMGKMAVFLYFVILMQRYAFSMDEKFKAEEKCCVGLMRSPDPFEVYASRDD